MWTNPFLIDLGGVARNPYHDVLLDTIKNYDWSKPNLQETYLDGSHGIWFPFYDGGYEPLGISRKTDPADMMVVEMCKPLLGHISTAFPGWKFVKGELINCPPNTKQNTHIDPRLFHRFGHRIHIPLLTNASSMLSIRDEGSDAMVDHHLFPFRMYTFNNLVLHHSYNAGDTMRIHLVVDIMPGDHWLILKNAGINLFDKCKDTVIDRESYLNIVLDQHVSRS